MFQRFRFNSLSAFWYRLILLQFVVLYQPALAQSDLAEENQSNITTPLLADNQLIHAIQLNRAYHVKQLLNKGHNPNTVDSQGNPMLILALYEDAFDAAWVLLEHPRININQANPHHETALMLACLKGQIKIVKAMIQQHHAQINHSGWTALHYAASTGQLEIARFLLQHHAEVDTRSPNGTTPLMMAARGGHIHVAKLLLDMGADVFLKNTIGLNAADFAERYHQNEIASGLRSRMDKLKALEH